MCVATTTGSSKLGYDDLPELLTRLTGDEKHDWSALSTLDVLWVLYDGVLQSCFSSPVSRVSSSGRSS